MAEVTTSIVVSFGGDPSGMLVAEIDSRVAGLNGGVTSFVPSDTVFFLMYASDNVKQNPILFDSSYGAVASAGSGSVQVTEILTFNGGNEATTSKPVSSGFSYAWMGKDLGVPKVIDNNRIRVPTAGAGVLQVTYTANYTAHSISSPLTLAGTDVFSIVVTANGTASTNPI